MTLTLKDVVKNRQCMGCGFCRLPLGDRESATKVRIGLDESGERYVPVSGLESKVEDEVICPGAKMDLPDLALQVYGSSEPADPLVGHYRKIMAAYAGDHDHRSGSASGGVVSVTLRYLFEQNRIDAAYCVVPGNSPKEARGVVIRSAEQLNQIHGSVYHPADFGASLPELIQGEERFAFVGLPCEVAGLEMLKRRRPKLAFRHVISLGLFCGGINSFSGIGYYLENWGIPIQDVAEINYRNGDWPGDIRLTRKSSGNVQQLPRIRGNTRWKILRYIIGFQGYWMLERCRICPDQMSDFADIAVGDPHLPRFRKGDKRGYSALVARSDRGEQLVREMEARGVLGTEPLSRDELVTSQSYTLDNRRQVEVYKRIARFFGMVPPEVKVYGGIEIYCRPRHRVYAFVDLLKLWLPKNRFIRGFYLPWQIFEYLFLTFAPQFIIRKLMGLVRNR